MSRIIASIICTVAFVAVCRFFSSLLDLDYANFAIGALAFLLFNLYCIVPENERKKTK